jgi:hypothetical protein
MGGLAQFRADHSGGVPSPRAEEIDPSVHNRRLAASVFGFRPSVVLRFVLPTLNAEWMQFSPAECAKDAQIRVLKRRDAESAEIRREKAIVLFSSYAYLGALCVSAFISSGAPRSLRILRLSPSVLVAQG